MPIKIKILKETKDFKKGVEILMNKKGAENYVSQGYAELVKPMIEKTEEKPKETILPVQEKYCFNNEVIKNEIKPSVGFIKDKMYFGLMIPTHTPIFDKKGECVGNEILPKLALLFDDNYIQKPSKYYQKDHNVLLKNECLTSNKPRWKLEKVEEWLNATKTKPYPVVPAKELFDRIKAQFSKYLWFNEPAYYNIIPLWIIGTYCHDVFQAYPYLNLWGFKNTGKTKVMQLSAILAFNSEIFLNMTVASLFRIIEQDSPTLFIDEAENLWDDKHKGEDDTSDIVACLNAGWMKGGEIPRIEKIDGELKINRFKVYCPKMFASIQGLKGALDTRCIKIVMVRPEGQPASQIWAADDDKDLLAIRDDLYPFMLSNWSLIKMFYSGNGEIKNDFGLENRDWQMWKPLLSIAKLVGDELFQEVGKYAKEDCDCNKEESMDEDSWDSVVVQALLNIVTIDEKKVYSVKTIKTEVDKGFIEKSYFDGKGVEQFVYRKDRPTSRFIGRLLGKTGFRKHRTKTERGYWLTKKGVVHRFRSYVVGLEEGVEGDEMADMTLLGGEGGMPQETSQTIKKPLHTPITDANVTTSPTTPQFMYESIENNILQAIGQDGIKSYLELEKRYRNLFSLTEAQFDQVMKDLKRKGLIFEPKPDQFEVVK